MKRILLLLTLLLGGIHLGIASPEQDLFAKASEYYKRGDFNAAILAYEQVIQEQGFRSANLYYNLGNSYYKVTDFPNAILNYERALKLDPGNEDVRFNLDLANTKIEDHLEQLPELFYISWYRQVQAALTQDAWAILFLVTLLVSMTSLIVFIMSKQSTWKRIGFYSSLACFLFSMIFLAFAFSMRNFEQNHHEAIVFAGSVSVKSSPVENGTGLFVLHAGSKVKIIDHLGDWIRVKLIDGNEGWMLSVDVIEI